MGRVSMDDIEKYQTQQSEWLSLSDDGDIAKVQFMDNNMSEVSAFVVHQVKRKNKDGKEYTAKVNCLRENYDDPVDVCPMCAAGLKPKPTIMLAFVDVEEKCIKIWERGVKFKGKLESLFNRYTPLTQKVFEIERQGKRGSTNTTYDVIPMDDKPLNINDFEKPEFLGTVILDKTASDMEYYLENEDFPREESDDDSSQGRTSRRRDSGSRTSRREESTQDSSRSSRTSRRRR